jgi:hypothetical protein
MKVLLEVLAEVPWWRLLSTMVDCVCKELHERPNGAHFCHWDIERLRRMADLIESAIRNQQTDSSQE